LGLQGSCEDLCFLRVLEVSVVSLFEEEKEGTYNLEHSDYISKTIGMRFDFVHTFFELFISEFGDARSNGLWRGFSWDFK